MDTTNILGRGAVKDTYNLLADGIVKLLWALAAVEKSTAKEWAKAQGYKRYLGSSVKGESAIDWSNKRARAALLDSIVADADRLLELSRQAHGELPEDSEERQRIVAAAKFQLYLVATVANLTLVASKAGLPEDTGGASKVGSALRAGTIHSTVDFIPARLCQIWALALLTSASLPKLISPNRAFRPGF